MTRTKCPRKEGLEVESLTFPLCIDEVDRNISGEIGYHLAARSAWGNKNFRVGGNRDG